LPAINANRQNFSVKKGELLFTEGDLVKGMFFIYSGKVKVHKKWGDDKELIVRLAKQGDIVGHRGIGGDIYYPVSATALEPVTVCFIDLDFFQATLKINHDFLYQLLMFFAAELKESEKRMRNLAHMPVKRRVAEALLALKNQFGTTKDGFINIDLSRQDLASYAGATYETVFRMINELVNDKLISLSGKHIRIVSEEALINFARNQS